MRHYPRKHNLKWAEMKAKHTGISTSLAVRCASCRGFFKNLSRHRKFCKPFLEAEKKESERKERLLAPRNVQLESFITMDMIHSSFLAFLRKEYSQLTATHYANYMRSFLLYCEERDANFSASSMWDSSKNLTLIPLSHLDRFLECKGPSSSMNILKAFRALVNYITWTAEDSTTHKLAKEFTQVNIFRQRAADKLRRLNKIIGRQVKPNRLIKILAQQRDGHLTSRPCDVLAMLTKLMKSEVLKKSTEVILQDGLCSPVVVRDHTMALLYLYSFGQRGNVIMNILEKEYTERQITEEGILIHVRQHKTAGSYGCARLFLRDRLAIQCLDHYVEVSRDMTPSPDGFLFRSINGVRMTNMRAAMDLIRALIKENGEKRDLKTLTTGSIRKAFSTLGQSIPNLREVMPWVQSHSAETANRFYNVDQDDSKFKQSAANIWGVMVDVHDHPETYGAFTGPLSQVAHNQKNRRAQEEEETVEEEQGQNLDAGGEVLVKKT